MQLCCRRPQAKKSYVVVIVDALGVVMEVLMRGSHFACHCAIFRSNWESNMWVSRQSLMSFSQLNGHRG
jgi:hypothetical protein